MMTINGTLRERVDTRAHILATNSMNDHQRRGFAIAITHSQLEAIILKGFLGVCAYCGQGMVFNDGGNHRPNSISVDVKNPSLKLLSKENVQVICSRCNNMKGSMNDQEFLDHCKKVVDRNEDNR